VTNSFAGEFEQRLAGLRNLSSSQPDKYRHLEEWVAEVFGFVTDEVATVYLSDLSKQFTARVGAALVSEPSILVVLGTGNFEKPNAQGLTHVDRLAEVCAYVGRIQLILVAEGVEGGPWSLRFTIGPHTSDAFASAEDLAPGTEVIPVIVPPL
jgi:hypothetical protein